MHEDCICIHGAIAGSGEGDAQPRVQHKRLGSEATIYGQHHECWWRALRGRPRLDRAAKISERRKAHLAADVVHVEEPHDAVRPVGGHRRRSHDFGRVFVLFKAKDNHERESPSWSFLW